MIRLKIFITCIGSKKVVDLQPYQSFHCNCRHGSCRNGMTEIYFLKSVNLGNFCLVQIRKGTNRCRREVLLAFVSCFVCDR